MATIEIGLLLAAQEDGVFDRPITESQQIFYKETVLTGFKIIEFIREMGGVDTSHVADRLKINQNTCRIYCRYLVQLGLISASKSKSQGSVMFYSVNEDSKRSNKIASHCDSNH